MRSPLVSVIIPTYNRSQTIQHAIQSVLEQSYQDLEVIVVDDGSEDDTRYVLEQLGMTDTRIRCLFHNSNRGAQAARNTGIRAAQGKWISFLDSDDYWLPSSLERRLKAAEQQHVKVVHSACKVIQENGIIESNFIPSLAGHVYCTLLTRPGTAFSALLVARETFEKIGYLDENIIAFQEWDTSIRLARYFQFGFLPEPTFIYDCQGNDTISKDALRSMVGYEQVVRKHRWDILWVSGRGSLLQHYQTISKYYLHTNNIKKARYYRAWIFILQPNRKHMQMLWQASRKKYQPGTSSRKNNGSI